MFLHRFIVLTRIGVSTRGHNDIILKNKIAALVACVEEEEEEVDEGGRSG